MYVIIGASGHIGSVVAQKLLQEGKQVRAIARDASRLDALKKAGAEIIVGSLYDTDLLYNAFQNSTAVLTMIPEDARVDDLVRHQDTVGGSISTALKLRRVPHVVNISSIGADVPEGTGPIAGLHRQEERLNRLEECDVLHIRPSYFMENFLRNIPLIQHMGINGSSLRSDVPIGMIATRDVGAVAAARLSNLDFRAKSVIDLMGPRDLTMNEATRMIGSAIGKPDLQYIAFSYDDAEQGMIQAGLSPSVAGSANEMFRAFNEGLIRHPERTPQNTTPTSFEDFAREVFAPAFEPAK
jgi:uncharacterized protein YbjT (DUF2867 family)